LRSHAKAPDADEAKMNAGRENGNPDVHHEADSFDEQDEGAEDRDDDVVLCDPGAIDLALAVLRMR